MICRGLRSYTRVEPRARGTSTERGAAAGACPSLPRFPHPFVFLFGAFAP